MWYVKKRMKSWLVTVLGLYDDGAFLNEGRREESRVQFYSVKSEMTIIHSSGFVK